MRVVAGLTFVFAVCNVYGGIVPNGTFEDGAGDVSGWEMERGNGNWAPSGFESSRCLAALGGGEDDAIWLSDPVSLTAGKHYELRLMAKCSEGASGGCAVAGVTSVNRDLNLTEDWTPYSFVFRAPDDVESARLRFGQWHLKGTVYFDDVELIEAEPLYARTPGGELGQGELVNESEYSAKHLLASHYSNSARFLDSATARFNSNRWIFERGSQVTYRHQLMDNRFSNALVSVNLNDRTSGSCVVEASVDKAEWIELGVLSGEESQAFAIPASLLPAGEIYIRLESGDEDNAAFQINGYELKADLETACEPQAGDTVLYSVLERRSGLSMSLESLPRLLPGVDSSIPVTVSNQSDGAVDIKVVAADSDSLTVLGESSSLSVAAHSTSRYDLSCRIGKTGGHTICFEAIDGSEETLCRASVTFNVPLLEDALYGSTLYESENGAIWWCGSTYKVSRDRPAPSERSDRIRISAARGEYEPFQVILRSTGKQEAVRARLDGFYGQDGAEIGKDCVDIRHVEYVSIAAPSDSIGCIGYWPDPLPPYTGAFDLPADRNHPLWIVVHAPRDAKPGVYKGLLRLDGANWGFVYPVELEVYNFEIPERMRLQTAFGFSPNMLKAYHHPGNDEEFRRIVDLYYQDFAAHRISPYDPTSLDPIRHELKKDDSGELNYSFDFSGFDRAGERYFDELGFTGLRLHLQGMGSGTFHSRHKGKISDFEQGTPEHERLFAQYAQTVETHLREKGWLDRNYIYWFDEPDPKDYEFVREGMEMIHRHAPGLRRFLTEQPEEKLFGAADVWCLILDQYREEICRKRQALGEEIWWYICTGPKTPYPGLFIDHHAIDLRIWLWMTYKYDVEGILVWESNYWSSNLAYPPPALQDPWEDPMSWVTGYGRKVGVKSPWGNGDGRFIYPPKEWKSSAAVVSGPVSSIRWEMLREGIEDWEYFKTLEELVAGGDIPESMRRRGRELLDIPERIIGGTNVYTKDPEELVRRRNAIGRAITDIENACAELR